MSSILTAKPCSIVLPILVAGAISGCSAVTGRTSATDTKAGSERGLMVAPIKTGTFTPAGTYIPSAQEKAQGCKRLHGKMGVRLVQLQRTGIVRDSSTLSRKFSGYFGNNKRTFDAATARKRDRAKLEAYNQILASKKCETFDLEKELAKPK